MDAISTIEQVLRSGLLSENLVFAPSAGVLPAQLSALEIILPRSISPQHRALLARWNGIDLDVIRVLGTGNIEGQLPRIEDNQALSTETGHAGAIAIANDPSGFVYFELPDGSVIAWDHDGGGTTFMASDINDFFGQTVFGSRGAEFFGEE
ncbi:SMI1/KNR4 family protein [Xanthomonas sp. D-109]|uniref:SMI1/KNR4 family protein n=1 Tax=Xanthomonas sp. D-109 TaxID=2821274 RepID=UPI001AD96A78|nr:SMI1/KNR4 family protein [Xanthomonas sp. D-109]MBO9880699.1 SMI1/KNR4 family protein [Xanthomonas sp. D-109]